MRILAVGIFPWPSDSGSKIRFLNVLEALANVGDVDLFAIVAPENVSSCVLPPDAPLARARIVARPASRHRGFRRFLWATGGVLPTDLLRDFELVRADFGKWTRPGYDLVWFSRIESFLALAPLTRTRTIVDFDDLEDFKIIARLRAIEARGHPFNLRESLHFSGARFQANKNVRLWRKLQMRTAHVADAVLVTSEVDRRRLGFPNAHVMPNGYWPPEVHPSRNRAQETPTILFQGLLEYPPNCDAARYLVHGVAPLVREHVPGLRVRLVGKATEEVHELHDPPHVVVTGWVSDIKSELALADLVAVPISYGGGTRIKILEAFAHRIPVVSTSMGAEGLEVTHGRHLLIADTPGSFAAACVQLLEDRQRRELVVDAAHRLFIERYQWSKIRTSISTLAERVGSPTLSVRFVTSDSA